MSPENQRKLESYRSIYMDKSGGEPGWAHEVLRIIREEWNPHYSVFLFCDHCKMQMLEYAFQHMDADRTDIVKVL